MSQVIFPTIVYRQIISLIIQCITIPMGQKFTYTKLTGPLNSSENSRKWCNGYRSLYASINTMGPRSRHTAQEGDTFCLLEMNVLWGEKRKSIPEQQQRTLWSCCKKQEQISISTVKQVLYWHNLTGRSARKKSLLQNHHKKDRIRFATAHHSPRSHSSSDVFCPRLVVSCIYIYIYNFFHIHFIFIFHQLIF